MTWSNVNKAFRQELNNTMNVVCDLCKEAYMVVGSSIITYCDDCIEELERNVPDD
jgi:hypothetical protein